MYVSIWTYMTFLKKLTFATPSFQLLTNHYEQSWKYYCLIGGLGHLGSASEEELHLSRKLFWGVFNALSRKVQLDQLFSLFQNNHLMLTEVMG